MFKKNLLWWILSWSTKSQAYCSRPEGQAWNCVNKGQMSMLVTGMYIHNFRLFLWRTVNNQFDIVHQLVCFMLAFLFSIYSERPLREQLYENVVKFDGWSNFIDEASKLLIFYQINFNSKISFPVLLLSWIQPIGTKNKPRYQRVFYSYSSSFLMKT